MKESREKVVLRSKSTGTLLAQHVSSRGMNLTETLPAFCLVVVKITLWKALLHAREPPQRFLIAIAEGCLEGTTKRGL